MPFRAGVEQIDGAGGSLAADLDARHLIANFERQVEMRLRLALALRQGEGRFAERLAASGDGLDHAGARTFGAARDARGEPAAFARGLIERQRRVVALGPQHDDAARGAGELGEARGEGRPVAIVEAVGEPQHAVIGLAAELAPSVSASALRSGA